jgi:hypothetical protein
MEFGAVPAMADACDQRTSGDFATGKSRNFNHPDIAILGLGVDGCI